MMRHAEFGASVAAKKKIVGKARYTAIVNKTVSGLPKAERKETRRILMGYPTWAKRQLGKLK